MKNEKSNMAEITSGCETLADGVDEHTHLIGHKIESLIFKLSGKYFHFL
jgi:formylmethanofuran dehydrogenase subunit A